MLNWIVWNRTVYMHKNGFGINDLQWLMCQKTKPNKPLSTTGILKVLKNWLTMRKAAWTLAQIQVEYLFFFSNVHIFRWDMHTYKKNDEDKSIGPLIALCEDWTHNHQGNIKITSLILTLVTIVVWWYLVKYSFGLGSQVITDFRRLTSYYNCCHLLNFEPSWLRL